MNTQNTQSSTMSTGTMSTGTGSNTFQISVQQGGVLNIYNESDSNNSKRKIDELTNHVQYLSNEILALKRAYFGPQPNYQSYGFRDAFNKDPNLNSILDVDEPKANSNPFVPVQEVINSDNQSNVSNANIQHSQDAIIDNTHINENHSNENTRDVDEPSVLSNPVVPLVSDGSDEVINSDNQSSFSNDQDSIINNTHNNDNTRDVDKPSAVSDGSDEIFNSSFSNDVNAQQDANIGSIMDSVEENESHESNNSTDTEEDISPTDTNDVNSEPQHLDFDNVLATSGETSKIKFEIKNDMVDGKLVCHVKVFVDETQIEEKNLVRKRSSKNFVRNMIRRLCEFNKKCKISTVPFNQATMIDILYNQKHYVFQVDEQDVKENEYGWIIQKQARVTFNKDVSLFNIGLLCHHDSITLKTKFLSWLSDSRVDQLNGIFWIDIHQKRAEIKRANRDNIQEQTILETVHLSLGSRKSTRCFM